LKLSRIARNAFSGYVAWLAESISGAKTIKTLAIENTVQREADEIVTDIRNKTFKRMKFQAYFRPSVIFVMSLTTAIVIFFGSMFMEANTTITVATFALYIGFVRAIFNPLQEFAELFGDIVATQSSVEKIVSLIDTKPGIVDTPEVIEKYGTLFDQKRENFEPIKGEIEFRHVDFSYLKDIEVIHDLNLKIKAGQSIAIVGETGSGKSTTVNLLCRFYEPTAGELLIDGSDYRTRSVAWLRSNIGYVQQTPFIFSGTIRKNIAYGKLDATDEEIIKAAKLVDVHEFIMSLPNGYDTILRDGGSELSVGQKQLISFARAIVRNPAIMILDEATSSIDTETEVVIQKAIKDVLKGRTSIIIAHRLSTIVDSDRILVMSDGRIIEDGTHRDLINAKGTYHKLYMNQFAELKLEEQIETYTNQIEGIAD
jgi:ATP-binding cassette subfamily B protein